MKCPICGQELRPGKKDPNYLLCYNCKKKFKVPQKKVKTSAETDRGRDEEEEPRYSNIPPKKVREKRETEMRKAYDELLAVEDNTKKKKKKRPKPEPEPEDILDDTYDDDYDDDDYEDEGGSKLPIIILAIAIVIVGALIAYMLLFR